MPTIGRKLRGDTRRLGLFLSNLLDSGPHVEVQLPVGYQNTLQLLAHPQSYVVSSVGKAYVAQAPH